jgi:hypothetical protein
MSNIPIAGGKEVSVLKRASIVLAFAVLVGSVSAQTVNITGKVSNSGGQGIQGAVVKIFATAMACTTKSDGTYLLSGSTAILDNISKMSAPTVLYKNGSLAFHVASSVRASVKLYDLRGGLVATVFSGILTSGNTVIPFSMNRFGHAAYLLHVTVGGNDVVYKLTPASKGFSISGPSLSSCKLSKIAAIDWIQASKTGFASSIKTLDSYNTTVDFTLGAMPAAPNFGPNVKIFDPSMSMSTIQSTIDGVAGLTGQFLTTRAAFLFKPGNYSLTATMDYYMQAYGLGMSPEDVQVTGAVQAIKGNTGSFWRGVEGFSVSPSGGTSVWAVSQADPFRRMHIKGQMSLCNSGASGGFISDSKIDGTINTNCGQQFYIRNSVLNGVNDGGVNGMWNLLIQGCDNPPAEDYPSSGGTTIVAKTPLVREKPFITIDASGNYSVFVPALRKDCQGITWGSGTQAGEMMPIDQFFIAIAGTDNATTINAALSQGKNLILTPGIYLIDAPLLVQRPNTIVLGLGMATLQAQNGVIALKTADVDGITIANVLIDAGTGGDSPVLFQVGDPGSTADHSANPPFIFDLFIRSGGAVAGTCKVGAIFNSNNTVLDHCWIWRADHGAGRGWITDTNTVRNGLIINGNNCITYGQMVEHWQKYNTVWNGNNGRQYFYQHEFNYDVPDQASFMEGATLGMPAIKVTNGVTNFEGWGLGIYSYFRVAPITVTNAMEVPKVPGVKLHHIVTFSLDRDQGTILHAVNDTGPAAKYQVKNMIRFDEYVGH